LSRFSLEETDKQKMTVHTFFSPKGDIFRKKMKLIATDSENSSIRLLHNILLTNILHHKNIFAYLH